MRMHRLFTLLLLGIFTFLCVLYHQLVKVTSYGESLSLIEDHPFVLEKTELMKRVELPSRLPHSDWEKMIIQRPLFAEDRKPFVAPPPPEPVLPRITAIIIVGGDRKAIFAPSLGRYITLRERDRIGQLAIDAIVSDRLYVSGPDGFAELRAKPDEERLQLAPESVAAADGNTAMAVSIIGSLTTKALQDSETHLWGDMTSLPRPQPMSLPR